MVVSWIFILIQENIQFALSFGNEIESIREFDVDSQRSVAFLDRVSIVPDISNIQQKSLYNFLHFLGEKVHFVVKDESLILIVLQSFMMTLLNVMTQKAKNCLRKMTDATSFKSIIDEKAGSLLYWIQCNYRN